MHLGDELWVGGGLQGLGGQPVNASAVQDLMDAFAAHHSHSSDGLGSASLVKDQVPNASPRSRELHRASRQICRRTNRPPQPHRILGRAADPPQPPTLGQRDLPDGHLRGTSHRYLRELSEAD